MAEYLDIPRATRLWLRGIWVHGEEACRITKQKKYEDDSKYAVELLFKVLQEFEVAPQNLQEHLVNFWKTARAYGKSLRVGWEDDWQALKMKMLDDDAYPIPITLKLEALIKVESFVQMDYHTCMTALKVYQYLYIRMKGKDPVEKVIPPRPRASPQAPVDETNPLLEWFLNRRSITRDMNELPVLLGPPSDSFNFANLSRR